MVQARKYKTCKRYDEPGDAHALTFTCFRGQPFFARDRTCRWMLEAIERARQLHTFDVWAYVIMPEHAHMLILPQTAEYSMSRILTSLKQPVSKRAILYLRREAPHFLPRMTDRQPNGKTSLRFWQRGGGYDRNIRSPQYVWETIDYIHANPLRRGLCDTPTSWAWSSARAYAGEAYDGPTINMNSLPDDPRGWGRRR
ncbi:MAG: transposase [Planctomycetes bacterium]|nr:transposase [Planctomycetota bacterium]